MAASESSEGSGCSGKSDCNEDLLLLLECLHFQKGELSCVLQTLTTITSMFYTSSSARDMFRSRGGLGTVLELVYSSRQEHRLQQEALYTLGCACDGNVVNRMKLCDAKLFAFLSEKVLSSSSSSSSPSPSPSPRPPSLLTCAAWLLGCVLTGNGPGQNLARRNGLIHTLIALFKAQLPSVVDPRTAGTEAGSYPVHLWATLCGALCAATNNPQNELNQSLCSHVFPAALSLLQQPCHASELLRPTLSVLMSCIAGNVSMQDRLCTVGGLSILVSSLKELLSAGEGHLEPSTSESAILLVKTISAAAFEHVGNSVVLCSLGLLPVLLLLLKQDSLDGPARLTVVMCLGVLIENNRLGQKEVVHSGGLKLLLKCMANCRNEEMCKAATFVMQCCVLDTDAEDSCVSSPQCSEDEVVARMSRLDALLDPSAPLSPPSAHGLSTQNEGLQVFDRLKIPVRDRVCSWLASNVPELEAPYIDTSTAGNDAQSVSAQASPHQHTNAVESQKRSIYLQDRDLPLEKKHCMPAFDGLPLKPTASSRPGLEIVQDPTKMQLQNLRSVYFAAKEAQAPKPVDLRVASNGECSCGIRVQCDGSCEQAGLSSRARHHARPVSSKGGKVDDLCKTTQLTHWTHEANKQTLLEAEQSNQSRTESVKLSAANGVQRNFQHRVQVHSCKLATNSSPGCAGMHSTSQENISADENTKCTIQSRKPAQTLCQPSTSKSKCRNGTDRHARSIRKSLQKTFHVEKQKRLLPATNNCNSLVSLPSVASTSSKLLTEPSDLSLQCAELPSSNATPQVNTPKVLSSIFETPTTPTKAVGIQHSNVAGNDVISSSRCCLGCKPRLKCPLITSKNFVKMLRADCCTCQYHKRLVNRMRQCRGSAFMHTNRVVRSVHSTCRNTDLCPSALHRNQPDTLRSNHLLVHQQEAATSVPDSTLQLDSTVSVSRPRASPEVRKEDIVPRNRSGYQQLTDICFAEDSTAYSLDLRAGPSGTCLSQKKDCLSLKKGKLSARLKQPEPCPEIKLDKYPTNPVQKRVVTNTVIKKKQVAHLKPSRKVLGNVTNRNSALSVFDYSTASDRSSPREPRTKCSANLCASSEKPTCSSKPRIKFTRQEERNLLCGVGKVGRRWRHILAGYYFHPSRTVVDLKDKYRNLQAKDLV